MLQFLAKPYFLYIAVFVILLSFVGASYYWGRQSAKADFIEEQAKQFQDTTSKVNQGLNEVRRANPSRDAGVALDRLRERQTQR